ncbi:MAG: efflux RND transporter periplasmic adaptor subunit [Spirochaetaceae bacterium]|jgi:multidrug efflux pump subunit AcrA (membrane-fusion protein)|nr:efflux RND transporter periplasmic adaptor subunit [Spirochaetaceae bacterium]
MALFSCKNRNDPNPEVYIHSVKGIELDYQQITPKIHSFGSVSYETKADLTATVEGHLDSWMVEEGDVINNGQLLAQFSNIQLEIQNEKVIAQLNNAQRELQLAESNLLDSQLQMNSRFIEEEKNLLELQQQYTELLLQESDFEDKKRVYEAGGITQETLEKLANDLQSAKTSYNIALKNREILLIGLRREDLIAHGFIVPQTEEEFREALIDLNTRSVQAKVEVAHSMVFTAEQELSSIGQLLDELNIRSPISGIVGATYLEEGERVKEGDKIITIFNTDKVYVVFPVQESDVNKIKEGQKAFVKIDALGENTIEGHIEHISPMIDPQSGNLTVKVLLNNPLGEFRPGMFARVDIVYDTPQQLLQIPESAILRKQESQGEVFIVRNQHTVLQQIELGEQRENNITVISGLEPGDIIIDAPSPVLREGDKVEVY